MTRRFSSLLALVLALTLLTGCSMEQFTAFLTGSEPAETQEDQEASDAPVETPADEMASETVLTEAEAPEVLRLPYQSAYGLNPFVSESFANRAVMSLVYEPLFQVNGSYVAEPVLAESAAVSEDGKTTTIALRSGVVFHSGAAMTAQDVVYSYTQARDSYYYDSRFVHFSSVTAPDDKTVVITTDTAMESVALLLDFPIVRSGTADVPQTESNQAEDADAAEAEPASTVTDKDLIPDGTGPFLFEAPSTLRRFDRWWGGDTLALPYDEAEVVLCDTATDIRDHFEYGSVNLVYTDPNASAYATFHNETDYELWSCPTTVMQYLGFNLNSDLYSNAALRAALTYGIDREALVSQALGGFATAVSLPAVPGSAYYDAGLAAGFDYDPAQFQAQLDKAQIQDYNDDGKLDIYFEGYAIPVGGKLIVNAGSSQRVEAANLIADSLNELGFSITVEAMDSSDFREALRYGNYDLYYGEVRLSPNFDLGCFFREHSLGSYGGMTNSTMLTLCAAMLENSGNAYDLHKRVLEQGYLCPLLFKTYALYTARGATDGLSPAVDWPLGQLSRTSTPEQTDTPVE